MPLPSSASFEKSDEWASARADVQSLFREKLSYAPFLLADTEGIRGLLSGWLGREFEQEQIGLEDAQHLILAALHRATQLEQLDPEIAGTPAFVDAKALREGVRGYLFLEVSGSSWRPTAASDIEALWPKGSGDKNPFFMAIARRRWGATLASRSRSPDRSQRVVSDRRASEIRPLLGERLTQDLLAFCLDVEGRNAFLSHRYGWQPSASEPSSSASASDQGVSHARNRQRDPVEGASTPFAQTKDSPPVVGNSEPAEPASPVAGLSEPHAMSTSGDAGKEHRGGPSRSTHAEATAAGGDSNQPDSVNSRSEDNQFNRMRRFYRRQRNRVRRVTAAVLVVGATAAIVISQFVALGQVDTGPSTGSIAPPPGDDGVFPIQPVSWGPPRDPVSALSRSSIVTLNSMIDNPVHGDERNFAQVRQSDAGDDTYVDEISIAPGSVYTGFVYFNNDAAPDLADSSARNTRLRLQLPAVVNGSANAQALLSADNATPGTVWDGFTVVLPSPTETAALRFVSDSAVLHTGGALNESTLDAEQLFGEEGVLLGCEEQDGTLPSTDACSGYVTFQFRVDQPNFTVDATARLKDSEQPFASQVDVTPGDVIQIRMLYVNSGTTQQDHVNLRVLGLPANFTYVNSSSKVANSKTNGQYESTDDGVTTTGLDLGSYAPLSNFYFTFDAIVGSNSGAAWPAAQWIVAAPFARVTTSGGYKETSLTFTIFGQVQPTSAQSTADPLDYWEASSGPPLRETFLQDSGGSPYPSFNAITDHEGFGDERNFVGLRHEAAADLPNVWQDDVWAEVGDTFVMRVYVDNAGADSNDVTSAGWLQGSRLRVGLSQGNGEVSVYGVLSATNATTVWDGATVHFGPGAKVVFEPGTSLLENNAHADGGLTLGPEVFSASGALLGYQEMDGTIRPGFEYSSYVTFKLRVVDA